MQLSEFSHVKSALTRPRAKPETETSLASWKLPCLSCSLSAPTKVITILTSNTTRHIAMGFNSLTDWNTENSRSYQNWQLMNRYLTSRFKSTRILSMKWNTVFIYSIPLVRSLISLIYFPCGDSNMASKIWNLLDSLIVCIYTLFPVTSITSACYIVPIRVMSVLSHQCVNMSQGSWLF